MSLRTRTAQVAIGALVLAGGWAWLQSPPSGRVPKIKHPRDGYVRFVVRYGPPWEEGGPRSVAWSASIDHSFEQNGTLSVPDSDEGVTMTRADPGQIATLTAAPARRLKNDPHDTDVPELVCILRYGDTEFGRNVAYGWTGGCTVSKTVPPR